MSESSEEKLRVLLVDDEDFILEVGIKLLNKLGYQCVTAMSGNEAFKIYESYYKKGLRGNKLKQALKRDKAYSAAMEKSRKEAAKKGFEISKTDLEKYPLVRLIDFEILYKCRLAQKKKLSKEDKKMVKMILSQLEYDWRRPLKKEIERILKK